MDLAYSATINADEEEGKCTSAMAGVCLVSFASNFNSITPRPSPSPPRLRIDRSFASLKSKWVGETDYALPYLRLHLDIAKASSDHLEMVIEEPSSILF